MFVKITAKRQVTFPARVLEALGVKPGDRIELEEGPDGFVLRTRHIDRARLAPLRGKLRRGKGTFDLEAFRNQPHDRMIADDYRRAELTTLTLDRKMSALAQVRRL